MQIEMGKESLISAFAKLQRRFAGRPAADAEPDQADLLQEAFLRLWRSPREVESAGEAEALMRTAVRNLRTDEFRRQQAHPQEPIDDRDFRCETDEPSGDELLERTERIMAERLSERDRRILLMRDRNGWDFDEIADYFSISEANVRMIVSRTRRTIRTVYNELYGNR